jgi:hypothetical protein
LYDKTWTLLLDLDTESKVLAHALPPHLRRISCGLTPCVSSYRHFRRCLNVAMPTIWLSYGCGLQATSTQYLAPCCKAPPCHDCFTDDLLLLQACAELSQQHKTADATKLGQLVQEWLR